MREFLWVVRPDLRVTMRMANLGLEHHFVRLDDGTDLDEIIAWMDWMNIEGLAALGMVEEYTVE